MKVKFLLLFAFFTIFSQGAFSQWVHKNTKDGITITYGVKLNVTNKDTSMVVSLKVKDDILKNTIDYGSISLNASNVKDTTALDALLKSKYKALFTANGKTPILKHSKYVGDMALSVHDTLSAKFHRSYVYQGLLMFQSVLNGAKRDAANNGNINFKVMDTYPVVVSGFVCEEDVVINAAAFKTYLKQRQQSDSANKGIGYYLTALANFEGDMTMSQIRTQLNNSFTTTGWPQGGECGCCGNYSGNCLYWSAACLAHDMACQQCQHSWCFSGCKPTSCSGNTISYYWWAVKAITPF